jgi:hypothetical protein
LEQSVEQVVTMRNYVGLAEGKFESITECERCDPIAGDGIHEECTLGIEAVLTDSVGDTEPLEHPHCIWSQLDTRADFGELIGLFDDVGSPTSCGDREGSRQPADAASNNENVRACWAGH